MTHNVDNTRRAGARPQNAQGGQNARNAQGAQNSQQRQNAQNATQTGKPPVDRALTSEKVKELGLKAGWDQSKIDAALDKADANNDNKFSAAEFDALVTEMGTSGTNVGVYADALLANPRFAKGWDAARKGEVQREIERRANEQFAIAEDPAKTPTERLQAAQAAQKILKDAEKAAKEAGYDDLAGGLKDELTRAANQVSAAKIRTGDNAEVMKRIAAAKGDPEQLKAVRDLLPETDARRAVLTDIVDGKVKPEVATPLLAAMADNKGDAGDFKQAIGASKGDPAALETIAKALDAEVAGRPEGGKGVEAMKAQAALLREIAKAPTAGVREALVKAMDNANDFKGIGDARAAFAEATQAMETKEDLAALQAFAKAQGEAGNKYFSDAFSHRLELVAANFDALKAEPDVFGSIKNWIGDKTDSGKDFMGAVLTARNPATLDALQGIAEARGAYLKGDDFFDKLSGFFKGGTVSDEAFLGMSPAERRSTLQKLYTPERQKALGLDSGSKAPGEMTSQEAMDLIKQTTITGSRPTVADRAEEAARKDREALDAARDALRWIPASDPRRAEYAKRVEDLEAAFNTKWEPVPPQAAPPTAV